MDTDLSSINRKLAYLRHANQVNTLLLTWLSQAVCEAGDTARLRRIAQTVADMALLSEVQQDAALHEFQTLVARLCAESPESGG